VDVNSGHSTKVPFESRRLTVEEAVSSEAQLSSEPFDATKKGGNAQDRKSDPRHDEENQCSQWILVPTMEQVIDGDEALQEVEDSTGNDPRPDDSKASIGQTTQSVLSRIRRDTGVVESMNLVVPSAWMNRKKIKCL